ncbi:MAG: MFS transporter [Casimicrobiaceae bacterium]
MKRPPAQAASMPALRLWQLVWLAAAVFVISAGYGALLPQWQGWLTILNPGVSATAVSRHIGFLSGTYTAGVLVGAPFWGALADRIGLGRVLIVGLVGYVASLLVMLVPEFETLWGIYALRATTGFFVAAVVPVVSALVAKHTPKSQRARRFAWLGAMSLLGFLFGPALNIVARWVGPWVDDGTTSAALTAQAVIVLSAIFGAVMMLGLARTLPERIAAPVAEPKEGLSVTTDFAALLWLSGAVTFVVSGFMLGIVLQGQFHIGISPRKVAMLLGECALAMLAVDALLFFTALLDKVPARRVVGTGLLLAIVGLTVLAWHHSDAWVYAGISFTSVGTGLILPVIAYRAAGASRGSLGTTMGGLAAAAGLGQTLGAAAGGWLFGALVQTSFAWLAAPLVGIFVILLVRPAWGAVAPDGSRPGALTRRMAHP